MTESTVLYTAACLETDRVVLVLSDILPEGKLRNVRSAHKV